MSVCTLTKQDRVTNYLMKGKTLNQDSAFSMFGVGNLRATISDIKPTLKSQGYSVYKTEGRDGTTRYGVVRNRKNRR